MDVLLGGRGTRARSDKVSGDSAMEKTMRPVGLCWRRRRIRRRRRRRGTTASDFGAMWAGSDAAQSVLRRALALRGPEPIGARGGVTEAAWLDDSRVINVPCGSPRRRRGTRTGAIPMWADFPLELGRTAPGRAKFTPGPGGRFFCRPNHGASAQGRRTNPTRPFSPNRETPRGSSISCLTPTGRRSPQSRRLFRFRRHCRLSRDLF
jgi:hypothetical protein